MSGAGEPDLRSFAGWEVGATILDIGAGRGRALAGAEGLGVVLLDRRPMALAGAPGGSLRVVGDAEHLPLSAASVGGVVLRAVVHHLRQPSMVLREAARVVRPGGAVIVVDRVAPQGDRAQALRNAVDRLRDAGHVWTWTADELVTLGRSARLDTEETIAWVEEKELEEWLHRTSPPAVRAGWVREMVARDMACGGAALAPSVREGRTFIRETWCAVRMRKAEARS